ncbi:MAG: FTR1 family iron permease [Clostridiales bacterium]|nr:FTR1 family iron permease [Clostridiales bacterium]
MAVTLAAAILFFPRTAAYAATDDYYATWDEYKASGQSAITWNDVADAMDAVFERGKELFAAGDMTGAYDCVNAGYYGYYETTGFERIAMGYISGSRKTEVELQFSACKAVAKKGGTAEEFNAEIETLSSMIRKDANVLDGIPGESKSGGDASTSGARSAGVAAFMACFSIMLREGFEAILIVGAIIAYLNKSEAGKNGKRGVMPVYIGSLMGIASSFGLAALLNAIKLANTASQEIIEGVTALLAVTVLYYVSNWMLSKSESDAWNYYIKTKVERSSEKRSVFALAFTAFLAVFREGAEVVLFFQPMLAGDNIDMVWAGFVVGCICLVFVYLAIRLLSIRIPLKPFFTATSVLMFLMSISFLGAGVKELIEGDVITMVSPSWLQWIPSNDLMDVLGIYPIVQTLAPQLLLMAVTVVIFIRTTKKNNAIHAEAEAKRAEERAAKEAAEKKASEEALAAKVREIALQVFEEKMLEFK